MAKLTPPVHEWAFDGSSPFADLGTSQSKPALTSYGTLDNEPGIFADGKSAANGTSGASLASAPSEFDPLGLNFTMRALVRCDKITSSGGSSYYYIWRYEYSPFGYAFGMYFTSTGDYAGGFVVIGGTVYSVVAGSSRSVGVGMGFLDMVMVRDHALLSVYINGCLVGENNTLPASTDVDNPGGAPRMLEVPAGTTAYLGDGCLNLVQHYDYSMTPDQVMRLFNDPEPVVTATSPEPSADPDTEFYFDVVSAATGVGIDYSTCTVYVSINGYEQLAYDGSTDSFMGIYTGTNSLRSAITNGFRFNFDTTQDIGPSKSVVVRLSVADNRGNWLTDYEWSFTTAARLARFIHQYQPGIIRQTMGLWRMDSPNLGTVYNVEQINGSNHDLTEVNTSIIAVSDDKLDFKRARRLNGTSAYITMSYLSAFDINQFTINMLIRINSVTAGEHGLVTRTSNWGGTPLDQGFAWWLAREQNELTGAWETRMYWGGGRPYASPDQFHTARSGDISHLLPLGKWINLFAWFHGGSNDPDITQGPRLYIDGQGVGVATLVEGSAWTYWGSVDAGSPDIYIGRTPGGDYLHADIAEIEWNSEHLPYYTRKYAMQRSFDTARLSKKPVVDSDHVALYIFDNDSTPGVLGSTVEDETGNHDGVVEIASLAVVRSPCRAEGTPTTNYDIGLAKTSGSNFRRIKVSHHADFDDLTDGLTIELAITPYAGGGVLLSKYDGILGGIQLAVGSFIPDLLLTIEDKAGETLSLQYDLRNTGGAAYANLFRKLAIVYDPTTKHLYVAEGGSVYYDAEDTNASFNHNNYGSGTDLYLFTDPDSVDPADGWKGVIHYLSWVKRVKPLNEIFNDQRGTTF